MRLPTLVLAAGLFWPAPAFSQALPGYFMSGNELYTDCTASLGTMERQFSLTGRIFTVPCVCRVALLEIKLQKWLQTIFARIRRGGITLQRNRCS